MTQHSFKGPYFVDIEPRQPAKDTPFDAVQISIKTLNGFDYTTYIKPVHTSPADYHLLGFPPDILKVSPTLEDVNKVADAIFRGNEVFSFNVPTEAKYIAVLNETDSSGNPVCQIQDLMWWLAPLVTGEWSRRHGTWKFPKQTAAAEAFGLTYDAPGPHDAGADVSMMIKLYQKLLKVRVSWRLQQERSGVHLVYDERQDQDLICNAEGHTPF